VVLEPPTFYIFSFIYTRHALQRREKEKISYFRKAKGTVSRKEDFHPASNKKGDGCSNFEATLTYRNAGGIALS